MRETCTGKRTEPRIFKSAVVGAWHRGGGSKLSCGPARGERTAVRVDEMQPQLGGMPPLGAYWHETRRPPVLHVTCHFRDMESPADFWHVTCAPDQGNILMVAIGTAKTLFWIGIFYPDEKISDGTAAGRPGRDFHTERSSECTFCTPPASAEAEGGSPSHTLAFS